MYQQKKIGYVQAFKMPGILALSSSFFCLKLATAGIYYWYPTYL